MEIMMYILSSALLLSLGYNVLQHVLRNLDKQEVVFHQNMRKHLQNQVDALERQVDIHEKIHRVDEALIKDYQQKLDDLQ